MTTTPQLDLRALARMHANLIWDLFQDLPDAGSDIFLTECYGIDWKAFDQEDRRPWPPSRGLWRPGRIIPAGRFFFTLAGGGPAVELRATRRRHNACAQDFDAAEVLAQHWGTPWIAAETTKLPPIQEALRWFAGNCLLHWT